MAHQMRKTFSGKPGRKRADNVARDASGRISRRLADKDARQVMTEREAKSVALDARRRQGIREEHIDITDGGKPNPGTVHGLLCLQGNLTLDQFYAAAWYLRQRSAFLKAIIAPSGECSSGEGRNHDVGDSDDYVEWCQAKRALWAAILDVIRDVSVSTRSPIGAAFDVVLVRQQSLDHLTGDLRSGLNAINNHFLQRAK